MNRDFDEPVTPPAQPTGRGVLGGAVAVSLFLHAVVGFALIHRVDRQLEEMEEAPLLVELVPPPEPEEPEQPDPPEPEPEEEEEPEPEPEPEEQAQANQADAPPPPIPVLRPVYEFAEADTGPKPDPEDLTINQPDQPEPDTAEAEESETSDPQELAAAESLLSAPQSEQVEAVAEQVEAVERIIALLTGQIEPEQEPSAPAPEEEETDDEVLTPAELLFTDAIREDPTFRTAMNGLPRSRRAGLLCMTEMRDQLRAAQRPPEYLPSFSLPGGTVMEPREAAFRSGGQWYDLAFRCELNLDVTRVLKFSYRIGDVIPRSQWAGRGFPNL